MFSVQYYYKKETQTLTLPYEFNSEISNVPLDTKILIFNQDITFYKDCFVGYSLFNQKVDELPDSITKIIFGRYFNQKVNNLPKNLIYLTFGAHFDQNVDNLPTGLLHLSLGRHFNQTVDELPKKLSYLKFGDKFNQNIDKLPGSLKSLTLGFEFNKTTDKLPNSLRQLGFYSYKSLKNNIPNFIEIIDIYFCGNEKYNESINNIPSNIKTVRINDKKRIDFIKKLPFGCILTDLEDNILLSN